MIHEGVEDGGVCKEGEDIGTSEKILVVGWGALAICVLERASLKAVWS